MYKNVLFVLGVLMLSSSSAFAWNTYKADDYNSGYARSWEQYKIDNRIETPVQKTWFSSFKDGVGSFFIAVKDFAVQAFNVTVDFFKSIGNAIKDIFIKEPEIQAPSMGTKFEASISDRSTEDIDMPQLDQTSGLTEREEITNIRQPLTDVDGLPEVLGESSKTIDVKPQLLKQLDFNPSAEQTDVKLSIIEMEIPATATLSEASVMPPAQIDLASQQMKLQQDIQRQQTVLNMQKQNGVYPAEKITAVLGPYRNPAQTAIYAESKVLYDKKEMNFVSLGVGMFVPDQGILGTLASGEGMENSKRIVVYGKDENGKIDTSSWQIAVFARTWQQDQNGTEIFKWRIYDEQEAIRQKLTQDAVDYFVNSTREDKR